MNIQPTDGKLPAYVALGVSSVLGLAIFCSYLLWENKKLQEQVNTQSAQIATFSGEQGPPIGSTISPLHGHTVSNQPLILDRSHRNNDTLLLVLSPVCPYCRVNFHNWRYIVRLVQPDQVVWVDLTNTADARYMESVSIPADSNMILLDQEDASAAKLGGTPMTVLLDPNGIVKWRWSGVMSKKQIDELQALLTGPHP